MTTLATDLLTMQPNLAREAAALEARLAELQVAAAAIPGVKARLKALRALCKAYDIPELVLTPPPIVEPEPAPAPPPLPAPPLLQPPPPPPLRPPPPPILRPPPPPLRASAQAQIAWSEQRLALLRDFEGSLKELQDRLLKLPGAYLARETIRSRREELGLTLRPDAPRRAALGPPQVLPPPLPASAKSKCELVEADGETINDWAVAQRMVFIGSNLAEINAKRAAFGLPQFLLVRRALNAA